MSKVQVDEICKTCGHPFHDHGWHVPIEESELGDHCDCKAMVGWYCPTCKKVMKNIFIDVEHIKDGICPETKTRTRCQECGCQVFDSQCVCFNFKR